MISACILHKNDLPNLFRAVASVHDCVEEVVIVDSGAHDYSALTARFTKVRILFYTGEFSYPKARNMAIDAAGGDWILFLDSDEELSPAQGEKIRRLTESGACDAYSLIIVNFFSNGAWSNFPVTRLFRKEPKVRYEKEIHETVNYALAAKGIVPQIRDVFITHYGYLKGEEAAYKKQERYVKLLEGQLRRTPDDAASFWHLAVSLKILHRDQEAAGAIKRAMEIAPENKIPFLFHARFLLADGAYSQAIDVLRQVLKMQKGEYWNPAAYNLLAMAHMEKGEFSHAIPALERAVEAQPWFLAALLNLSLCYREQGEDGLGRAACEKVLGLLPPLLHQEQITLKENPFRLQEDVSPIFIKKYRGSISALHKAYSGKPGV